MEHRVGGLEKSDGSGNVSYDPENHDHMTRLRHEKVDIIAKISCLQNRMVKRLENC